VLIARVIVDVPSQALDRAFDYALPDALSDVAVGDAVLVDFANRPVVGYVVDLPRTTDVDPEKLKSATARLGGPFFCSWAPAVAEWVAEHYLAPRSEALRLFLPPGGTPKAVRGRNGVGWELRRADVGAVDDRWVSITCEGRRLEIPARNTLQRALLDALSAGPVRAAELSADLGSIEAAVKRLSELGAITVERRRRYRQDGTRERSAPRFETLTPGQVDALGAIDGALTARGGVVLLDGVTGSGKTEVYLRAIERVVAEGGSAIVLVPEISLTPQTVGRFRTRFGDLVAVLHSRLSAGERFDQWDRVRAGDARVVVGARSALFAPAVDLRLIVVDEEHEPSYKQSSSPRYHARDVAVRLASEAGAAVVLGSASPALESLLRAETGEWTRVHLAERTNARPLPPVEIVDLGAEFEAGNRSMFSRPLAAALEEVQERGEKAVLFLNRRGFASFLLCRECGFVPRCDDCATSLTYHEVGTVVVCHHCGHKEPVPATCPKCSSPYLRRFGAGTQRVETELAERFPGLPVVRMDADTTRGKGGHERALAAFEALESGILLGTQMIAKGLDYPEVTLVGVITADTMLNLPDFRAGERTYQLLEQVAGRAGRGERPGTVIVQTYWPDHPAVLAAASHDPALFYPQERRDREELGYPPYVQLANILIWGRDSRAVTQHAERVAEAIREAVPDDFIVLGPSPSPLAKLKGIWRWHAIVKAPLDADIATPLRRALAGLKRIEGVSVTADVDPTDLV